jgi:hypothetical protein
LQLDFEVFTAKAAGVHFININNSTFPSLIVNSSVLYHQLILSFLHLSVNLPYQSQHNDCEYSNFTPPKISCCMLLTDDTQRRQARQRRDYLYRRALLLREAEVAEKRAKLRAALASGKPLDPEIANDKQLRKDYEYDVSRDIAGENPLDLDDEYSELSGIVGAFQPSFAQAS